MNFCLNAILNFYTKVISLKDFKRKKFDDLRDQIVSGHNFLQNLIELSQEKIDEIEISVLVSLIKPLFIISRINNNDSLVLVLDTLHKLISNKFFNKIANTVITESDDTVSQEITNIICQNAELSLIHENIQILLIKILQPFICDELNCVHGDELIKVVRVALFILCHTRLANNKNATFASLAQSVSTIFNRMENISKPIRHSISHPDKESVIENTADLDEIIKSQSISKTDDSSFGPSRVSSIADSDEKTDVKDKAVFSTKKKTMSVSDPKFSPRSQRAKFYECDENLCEFIREYNIEGLEAHIIDAAFLYYSLCKAPRIKPSLSTESIITKQVSLELVHIALNNAGKVFKENDFFNEITRRYLFPNITQNSITTNKQLFKLSLNIFLLLLDKFRSSFKIQISVFFESVIFYILEENIHLTFQVLIVLEELKNIFQNIKSSTVIFINYDCDLDSRNIFERLIEAICSLAKSPKNLFQTQAHLQNFDNFVPTSDYRVAVSALKCLNVIITTFKNEIEVSILKQLSSNTQENQTSQENGDEAISNNLESLSAVKEKKELLEEGIKLFNFKPLKGLKYLQDHQLLEPQPEKVATFFHQENRLDLSKIGEILGADDEYSLKIMHSYVDQINVKDMDFLQSLRLFISNFKLPGEAQKVDRLMEKFAGHYFDTNNNSCFKNADSAYILAYSIIMLTTDLHSPNVKSRITPELYIEMNKNPDGSSNLSEEYLTNIYNSIAAEPLKLKEHESHTKRFQISNDKSRNPEQILKFTKSIIQKMEKISEVSATFVETGDIGTTKSIFNTIWKYLIVCFGCVIQESEDPLVYQDAFNGIRNCIRIACLYQINLPRDAFLNSLVSFTLLSNSSLISDLSKKNIEALRVLLTVAKEDGNYISSAWNDIIQCMSNFENFQNNGTNNRSFHIDHTNINFERKHQNAARSISDYHPKHSNSLPETASQSISVLIDQLFISSSNLSSDSLIHFIVTLTSISLNDLSKSSKRCTFILQKIVEVAYYNMGRTRFEWIQIWSILGPYFIKAASFEDESIAFLCIDSLRQLSAKFLEREEFGNYHFQADFLKPFEHIMIHCEYVNVKELGVRCICQLVLSQAENIRSGWTTVFNVLSHASQEKSEVIEELSFQSMHSIMQHNFSVIVEWFDQALSCIKSFAYKSHSETFNIRAIHLLGSCLEKFKTYTNSLAKENEKKEEIFEEILWKQGWKNILKTLIEIIQNTCSYIRAEALLLLFNSLKIHKDTVLKHWWRDIFKILLSMFDILKKTDSEFSKKQKNIWLTETCTGALMGSLELYILTYENLPNSVTEDFIQHLKWCISQDFEILGTTSLFSFRRLVKLLGPKFDYKSWKEVYGFIDSALVTFLPTILLNDSNSETQIDDTHIMMKDKSWDNINNKQNSYLWDYSSYSLDNCKKFAQIIIVEKENSLDKKILDIHRALSLCHLDIELIEGLLTVLVHEEVPSSTYNSALTIQSPFWFMPDELLWKTLHLFSQHFKQLKSFNDSENRINQTAKYIEITSPAFKQTWRNSIAPRMLAQESACLSCIQWIVKLLCDKCNYNQKCVVKIIKYSNEILSRYQIFISFASDNTLIDQMLKRTLEMIRNLDQNIFKMVIGKIFPNLHPLIINCRDDICNKLTSKIFARLEPLITSYQ